MNVDAANAAPLPSNVKGLGSLKRRKGRHKKSVSNGMEALQTEDKDLEVYAAVFRQFRGRVENRKGGL